MPASVASVLVAPDKFRGTLSARQVADALASGLHDRARVQVLPLADGGEGSVDAVVSAGFELSALSLPGPSGVAVEAHLAQLGDIVFIETAEICGLQRVTGPFDALGATSLGVGLAIVSALDRGARTIVLGVGGTATTDGGAGLLTGLGARLLDSSGTPVSPGGGGLLELACVDLCGVDPRLANTSLVLASDVENPLLGPSGAAVTYGPQKGAGPIDVEVLELALSRLVSVLGSDELPQAAGSGAGGGLGFAALLLGAKRVPGATYLLDLLDFDSHLARCDLLVTGEGALDAQSLSGKLPVAVAKRAHAVGIPTIAVVGTCRLSADEWAGAGFDQVHALDALDPRCASDPELSLALLRGIGQALANPSS